MQTAVGLIHRAPEAIKDANASAGRFEPGSWRDRSRAEPYPASDKSGRDAPMLSKNLHSTSRRASGRPCFMS
jgi:hypothetical protein